MHFTHIIYDTHFVLRKRVVPIYILSKVKNLVYNTLNR